MRDETIRIAMQRFGLGATAFTRTRLGDDPRSALMAEIGPDAGLLRRPDLPDTPAALRFIAEIEERRRLAREARRQIAQAPQGKSSGDMPGGDMAGGDMAGRDKPVRDMAPAMPQPDADGPRLRDAAIAEAQARFTHAIAAPLGFAERWVMFWSNHFCVATRKGGLLQSIAGVYEREAIRPHVFGRFADLLRAAEQHPAMLHYLDQRQSIGPGSPVGIRQRKGLNENLAREILELHTLGVHGGYSQEDVTRFARALTGWTISSREDLLEGKGGFLFAANRHEPGVQRILGREYPQAGVEQGRAVLDDLAVHPATARFIAGKIARHFVADDPPPALVGRLEAEFRRSGGDLAAMARSLLSADEAWAIPLAKLRTPAEFVLAGLRATGLAAERMPQILNALNLMGQPLWNPPGPNGHADDAVTLAAPRSIKLRLDVSIQLARQGGPDLDPRALADALYGAALSGETRQAIARAETRPQGLAILLMAPEFQRR